MGVKKAIECIDDVLLCDLNFDESLEYDLTSDDIDWLEEAKKALEKQQPMKPKLVYGEKTNTHRLGRLISFHCPVCNHSFGGLYETDFERGGGFVGELKGCSECLQAIDFTGYYSKSSAKEEVVRLYEKIRFYIDSTLLCLSNNCQIYGLEYITRENY